MNNFFRENGRCFSVNRGTGGIKSSRVGRLYSDLTDVSTPYSMKRTLIDLTCDEDLSDFDTNPPPKKKRAALDSTQSWSTSELSESEDSEYERWKIVPLVKDEGIPISDLITPTVEFPYGDDLVVPDSPDQVMVEVETEPTPVVPPVDLTQPPTHDGCKYDKWFFTINNYTLEEYEDLVQSLSTQCKWAIVGKETGTANAVPHLQGTEFYSASFVCYCYCGHCSFKFQ